MSCGADVSFGCPECRARLPLGSRFCSECRIELARYRAPRLARLPNRVPSEDVEEALRRWLGSGWLRARDASARVVVMDRSLSWLPFWRFEARFAGTVTGQEAQTHYRTVSREVPVDRDLMPVLWLNLGTLLVCVLALIIPSMLVARIAPARAIRFA